MNLSEIKAGETFKTGTLEHIALEHREDGTTLCLLKNCIDRNMQFDKSTGNYANSTIRQYLNTDFYQKLSDEIGQENIIEHEVDLTADDGRNDYGTVTDKISLLTDSMVRKYIEILDKYSPDCWLWTATPLSTKRWTDCVRVVRDGGVLGSIYCFSGDGVRPFYILESSIFVSK